jgi:simple sugar transport system substrate-binding protein
VEHNATDDHPGGGATRRNFTALLGSGLAATGALGLLAACGGSTVVARPAGQASGRAFKVAVITHGDNGSFWSVVKRGASDAAQLTGVQLDYQGSKDDPAVQAKMISAVVASGVDGLAVSAAEPDAIAPSLEQARAQGIPVVTLNAGIDTYAKLGAFTHVGQDEMIAGRAAGQRIALAGAKRLLCIIHQKNNSGLQLRASGAKQGFGGAFEQLQVVGITDMTTTGQQIAAKLKADPSIDAVLTLGSDVCEVARQSIATAGSSATLSTFDLSPEVIKAVTDRTVSFAVDQQQYLQGYLPVLFLYLYNVNANTIGGGQPVLTGPSFDDRSNVLIVQKLIAQGTR